MQFHYIASRIDKGVVEGELEAEGLSQVLENLASRGLRPISVKVTKTKAISSKFGFFGNSIKSSDRIFLTKYLALMLKVGTNLFQAIDILIEDFDKPSLKALLVEIRANLEKGQPFYATFAHYPKLFSPVFVNLLKAGETSGNLDKTLEELSVSMEKDDNLAHKIRSSMVYPIILVVMSLGVTTFLLTFVLPKISSSFSSGNIEPPLFSKIVFAIGGFLENNLLAVFGFAFITLVGLFMFFKKTIVGNRLFWRLVAKMPLIGNVIKKIAIQRFATTLAALLRAGVPIVDSLEITADVVGNDEFSDSLRRVSREGVSRGVTIGDAFRRESFLPRTVVNLIAISEKAGHLESILMTLSNFYETEIVSTISALISILEPLLLVFLGAVIGTIALSILVPIYQLAGQL